MLKSEKSIINDIETCGMKVSVNNLPSLIIENVYLLLGAHDLQQDL